MTIKRLALMAIFLTYFLIVFGGYVASSESGMGCGPEWPLCNGEIIPTLQGDTLIEFAHRVIGAILGIISLILFIKIIRAKVSPRVRSVAYLMMLLLIIQVLLGAVVVLKHLPTSIIATHLIIALLFMSCLIWIFHRVDETSSYQILPSQHLNQRRIKLHLNIVLALIILTFIFGAYVKHESYGMACGSFLCGDSLFPTTLPEIIQSVHRGLAFISGIYIFILTFLSFKKGWGVKLQNRLIYSALTVLIQIALGILTIMNFIDISLAVLHLAAGTLLFAFVAEARIYSGGTAFLKSRLRIMTSDSVTNKTNL